MSISNKHLAVAEILIDIEKELSDLRLWESEMPSSDALASQEPFAVDTLNFPQWLQFIFIPRLYFMIDEDLPLPIQSGVKPMAELYFQESKLYATPLILHLEKIDRVLSQP